MLHNDCKLRYSIEKKKSKLSFSHHYSFILLKYYLYLHCRNGRMLSDWSVSVAK